MVAEPKLRWPLLAVFAFAVFWFRQIGGFHILDPRQMGWMLNGDWQASLVGWWFVRSAPWSVPFGMSPDLMWPYGSSAAFTDSIPIVATLSKFLLPTEPRAFQYWGLWILFAMLAQGTLAVWMARQRFKDGQAVALAGMFLVLNPVQMGRGGHITLMGQFLVFGLVAVCLTRVESVHGARRLAAFGLSLLFFASGTHAYMAAVTGALGVALMVRLALAERWFGRGEGAAWLASALFVTGGGLWLFGFFPRSKYAYALDAEGFGQFSFDLAALANPMGWSKYIPTLPVNGRQGEGLAYLGIGGMALFVVALGLAVWALVRGARPNAATFKRMGPLMLMVLATTTFAASNHVTFLGKEVLDLSALYAKLGSLPGIFRSSGRFVWPLHHLILFTGVAAVGAFVKNVWGQRALLAGALALQLADLNVANEGFLTAGGAVTVPQDPVWEQATVGYKHLAIHPIMSQWVCPYDPHEVAGLSWVATQHHMTMNSGHVGRNPVDVAQRCMKHLAPAELDAETIYVVHFPQFAPDLLDNGYVCGQIDGMVTCVKDGADTPMRHAIDAHRVGLKATP